MSGESRDAEDPARIIDAVVVDAAGQAVMLLRAPATVVELNTPAGGRWIVRPPECRTLDDAAALGPWGA